MSTQVPQTGTPAPEASSKEASPQPTTESPTTAIQTSAFARVFQSLPTPFQAHRTLVQRNATNQVKFPRAPAPSPVSSPPVDFPVFTPGATTSAATTPVVSAEASRTASPDPTGSPTVTSGPVMAGLTTTGASTTSAAPAPEAKPTVSPPSRSEIMKYRFHHGTNLGSCFVLERWLTPCAFPHDANADQKSELSCVSLSVANFGPDATRANFESRWVNILHDSDFDYLVNKAKCTTIRLPIGYWDLGGDLCVGTPFEQYASIYVNAWKSIVSLCNRASLRGIGILLDLHSLPGGANIHDHSGTDSKAAALWGNPSNLDKALKCLEFIAREVQYLENVVGIELCNEAHANAPGMYDWYDTVIKSLSSINPKMPVYISDGWDLRAAIDYSQKKNSVSDIWNVCPVVIDTHKYFCFSTADTQRSPQQIISLIPGELDALNLKDRAVASKGAVEVVVGEYSCVLAHSTWDKQGNADKAGLVKAFGNAESALWQSRTGGSFFWTYKMDWFPGGEWGFANCTDKGSIYPPAYFSTPFSDVTSRIGAARSTFTSLCEAACQKHIDHWNKQAPGNEMEHWRYDYGYGTGFNDAADFFEARSKGCGLGPTGADRIGCLEIWILKRFGDCNQCGCQYAWEFEHGFRKGVYDLEHAVGIISE